MSPGRRPVCGEEDETEEGGQHGGHRDHLGRRIRHSPVEGRSQGGPSDMIMVKRYGAAMPA